MSVLLDCEASRHATTVPKPGRGSSRCTKEVMSCTTGEESDWGCSQPDTAKLLQVTE